MDRRSALTEAFLSTLAFDETTHPNLFQAVEEIARDVVTIEKNDPDFASAKVLQRLTEPDRIVSFRVTWEDAQGDVQVNRGWRVQGSQAIGPYKGGLRFHPSVDEDTLRFLAFEQCFKNALTGLPLGGAKGGSDFDPKGRSIAEIMRFCQAFMRQVAPFIGPDRDVPAGDINVGPREIGYMFGAWRQESGTFGGALTGKGLSYGGSEMRVEATGFGLVYFVQNALAERDMTLKDKRVAISGKGNVATHAAQKAIQMGAKVVALSDTSGTLICEDGMSDDLIRWVQAQKDKGGAIDQPPAVYCATFHKDASPWDVKPDIALPCATQNEMDEDMAQTLIDGGCVCVAEGANMPLTDDAATALRGSDVMHIPGKAANAGGVAVSGLEMSQNSFRRSMTAEKVDDALQSIMSDIHKRVAEEGRDGDRIDYVKGANVAGYRRLAEAIVAQGII